MIIVGYYGLGKTTLCTENPGYIDLESKYFRENDSWMGTDREGLNRYIWLIEDLNRQGKIVFVSSNKEVREAIHKSDRIDTKKDVAFIYPSIDIKDAWMSRLYNRWKDSNLERDWYAYKRSTRNYESDIMSMEKDKGNTLSYVIDSKTLEDFDLERAVNYLISKLKERRRED